MQPTRNTGSDLAFFNRKGKLDIRMFKYKEHLRQGYIMGTMTFKWFAEFDGTWNQQCHN